MWKIIDWMLLKIKTKFKMGDPSSHLQFKNLHLLTDFDEIFLFECWLKINTKFWKWENENEQNWPLTAQTVVKALSDSQSPG